MYNGSPTIYYIQGYVYFIYFFRFVVQPLCFAQKCHNIFIQIEHFNYLYMIYILIEVICCRFLTFSTLGCITGSISFSSSNVKIIIHFIEICSIILLFYFLLNIFKIYIWLILPMCWIHCVVGLFGIGLKYLYLWGK